MCGVTGGDSVTSPRSGPAPRLPSVAGSPSFLDTLVERAPAAHAQRGVGSLTGIRSRVLSLAAGSHLIALPVPWPSLL